MRRREFDIRPPARQITWEDVRQEFHSGLLRSCRTTMSEMCRHNAGKTHVWVYVLYGKVAAVMAFTDEQDHLCLEVISNNFALPPDFRHDQKPGTRLYNALEIAAREAGIRRIKLDSVPDRVGYWEMLGFRASGPSYEGDFCTLYPMEKEL